MSETRSQTLSGNVALDGNRFIDVTFRDARLIYDGGIPPTIEACRFENTTFDFTGPAANTLGFLKAMAPVKTNMRAVVLGLIPELQH